MHIRIGLAVAALISFASIAVAGDTDDALSVIKSIKREGAGNEQAAAKWKELVSQGPKVLPELLAAFDGADTVAVNWLRSAAEAIVENEQKVGRPIPTLPLKEYVTDIKRAGRARETAYELLLQVDPDAKKRLLPAMRDDPSGYIRRDAVALELEALEAKALKADKAAHEKELRTLFAQARAVDQIEKLAKLIKDVGGNEPDVVGHLGLVTRWQVAGPFDNTGLKGFQAELPGKVEWKDHATGHPRGIVDLYVALGKKKGVDPATKKKDAVYALARVEVESPDDREVEIRAATQNAIRMYVNGEHVFSREEYHHGDTLDQHVGRAKLKKGSNEILVKVCQDDATMMWTLVWQFQLRVCDYLGTPAPIKILSALNAVPVKPEPEKKEPSK